MYFVKLIKSTREKKATGKVAEIKKSLKISQCETIQRKQQYLLAVMLMLL